MPLSESDWVEFHNALGTGSAKPITCRGGKWLQQEDKHIAAMPMLVATFTYKYRLVVVRFYLDKSGTTIVRGEHRLQWEAMGTLVRLEKNKNLAKVLGDCKTLKDQQDHELTSTLGGKGSTKVTPRTASERALGKVSELRTECTGLEERIVKANEQLFYARQEKGSFRLEKHVSAAKGCGESLARFMERYAYQMGEVREGFVGALFEAFKSEVIGAMQRRFQSKLDKLPGQIENAKGRVDRENLEREQRGLAEAMNLVVEVNATSKNAVSACYLQLARAMAAELAKIPVTGFVFSGFGDIDYGSLDFEKSLVDNMLAYLKDVGLSRLHETARQLKSPVAIQYILNVSRLLRNPDQADARLYGQVYDVRAPNTAVPKIEGLKDAISSDSARASMSNDLTEAYLRILAHFGEVFSIFADAVEAFGKLRIALLTTERTHYIVQRALQSGDSNGVAFALLSFNDYRLLYMFDAGDESKAIANMKFYESMGVARERIELVALKRSAEDDSKALVETFKDYRPRVMYFPGATNQLYQFIITKNKHYLNEKPELRALMDVAFHYEKNHFSEVGRSTSLVRHYILNKPNNAKQISKKLYWALEKKVEQKDRGAIRDYRDLFLQRLTNNYEEKIEKRSSKEWYKGLDFKSRKGPPLVLLMWIRGPQGEEGLLKNLQYDARTKRMVPIVGKPWHHATYQLLITMRQIAAILASELRVPVHLVPIGDELSTDFHYDVLPKNKQEQIFAEFEKVLEPGLEGEHGEVDSTASERRERKPEAFSREMTPPKIKRKKPHNLIRFFDDLEEFKNRNRFNQLYFIYSLFAHEKYRIAQVGLRSGALEQGAYLGVPTVYIDIEQKSLNVYKPGEPDTSARMMNMTAARQGFPFFHCLMSKNVIGIHPGTVDEIGKKLIHKKLSLGDEVSSEGEEALLLQGTLDSTEVAQMKELLKGIYESYGEHFTGLAPHLPPVAEPEIKAGEEDD